MDKTFSNTAITCWKLDGPYIGMFHRDNYWTPGRMNKEYKPMTLHSTITYTTLPVLATIQKNIDKHFERYVNRSNIPQHNNISDKKINLEKKDEQTVVWCNNTQKANDFDDLIHKQHIFENIDGSDNAKPGNIIRTHCT